MNLSSPNQAKEINKRLFTKLSSNTGTEAGSMTIGIVIHILKLILPLIIDIARKHDVISSIYELPGSDY